LPINKRDIHGVPYIHGKPFIWSESLWSLQKLRDVPDRLDGNFTLMPIYLSSGYGCINLNVVFSDKAGLKNRLYEILTNERRLK